MKNKIFTLTILLALAGCTQVNSGSSVTLYLPEKEDISSIRFTKFADKDTTFIETYESYEGNVLSFLDHLAEAEYLDRLESNEFPDTELIVMQIKSDQEYTYGMYYDEDQSIYILEDYNEMSSYTISEETYMIFDSKFDYLE